MDAVLVEKFIIEAGPAGVMAEAIEKAFAGTSRSTVNRRLTGLLASGLIRMQGRGRTTRYMATGPIIALTEPHWAENQPFFRSTVRPAFASMVLGPAVASMVLGPAVASMVVAFTRLHRATGTCSPVVAGHCLALRHSGRTRWCSCPGPRLATSAATGSR